MTWFKSSLVRAFILCFALLSLNAHADEFIEAIKKKYVPEINNPKVCKKGSDLIGGFLKVLRLDNKTFYLMNYHQIQCVGALSIFSGSAGAQYKVIDKKLNEYISFTAYNKEKHEPLMEFKVKVAPKLCPSRVRKLKLNYKNSKFSLEPIGCVK